VFFVAIILLSICAFIAVMPEEVVKILLVGAWVALGLMAAGSVIYSVGLLLS
jgi:hypothetical protein